MWVIGGYMRLDSDCEATLMKSSTLNVGSDTVAGSIAYTLAAVVVVGRALGGSFRSMLRGSKSLIVLVSRRQTKYVLY
ncbi:hypothetical protein GY45DRAFT_790142 [Cubamyces sp. BRFM 1775]|nr:hypothetical protein GY45DRAFT_790142 [Cubamyces sp. BRFM 1775]